MLKDECQTAAYFGKLDIICHCKTLWNGWQSSCRRYGKEFLFKVTCNQETIHEVKQDRNNPWRWNKTIMAHYTTTASDSRSIGECRSEVFFTSPPNTKKGRSGYGRSMEMHNFKVLSQLSWLLYAAVPSRNWVLFCSVFRVHHQVWCAIVLSFLKGRDSHVLHRRVRYSCVYRSHMSPTLSRSSVL